MLTNFFCCIIKIVFNLKKTKNILSDHVILLVTPKEGGEHNGKEESKEEGRSEKEGWREKEEALTI